jgi:uncharacterized membrane protein YfbV (UPF0208 family)
MSFWQHLLNRLRAVPAGVWAALGIATTILGLYLRGKRLQGELVKARAATEAAKALSAGATDVGKSMAHLDAAAKHRANAEVIKKTLSQIEFAGEEEQKRIHAMSQNQVTDEYLRMIRSQKPRG